MADIPKTMKAIRFSACGTPERYGELLTIEEVDVPVPKAGEVLVKVAFSTLNPSDAAFIAGSYAKQPEPPFGAGFEGCGVVVSSGGGFMAWRLLGKRVSFAGDALWSEYAVAPALSCVTLPDAVPLRAAAGALVNPLTVLSFLDIAKSGGHKYLVHTAAASALGKQLIRVGKKDGVEVVCVVRREEQAQICREAGATHVLNMTDADFAAQLQAKCKELDCKLAFDAIAGDMPSVLLKAVPEVHVYGGLSKQPKIAGIELGDFLFHGKRLHGFYLTRYMKSKSLYALWGFQQRVAALLTSELSTNWAYDVSLNDKAKLVEALQAYHKSSTAGKVLLRLTGDSSSAE